MTVLMLGYGNLDRQDDGIAWHILGELLLKYGHPYPESIDINTLDTKNDIHFFYQLQLLPEIADELSRYDRAVFIDAHTGDITEEIEVKRITPEFQSSPLTHHLTVNSLLFFAQSINIKVPDSILVSVKGYEFKFTQELSPRTKALVPVAANQIYKWVSKNELG